MKMVEAVEKSGLVHYGEVVEEFEVPVRGSSSRVESLRASISKVA